MKKRILSILCILALVLSLLSVPAMAAAGTKIPTSIPKSFPIVKQDAGVQVIKFWHAMTGRYAPLVDNIANWYNATIGKTKKIYIKTIFQGAYDEITTKMQATLQSGNIKDLPDLVQLNSAGAFSVKESKTILYMEDMMKADPSFKVKDKLNKNALWACSYKGKLLGMPFSNSMIALHYNATAFKAVGLDPNSPPRTMAEFAEAAKKLIIKGKGTKPVRYGGSLRAAAYQFSTWIPRQKNGTAYQFDQEDGRQGVPKKLLAAEEGTLKATLTEWKKALDTGVIDYVTIAPRANYEQGLNAMYMESMVQYDTIQQTFASQKDPAKRFESRMARIPAVSANDSIGEAIGGSAVYMFDKGNAASKAATWDFVKFLATADVSAYWYVNSGYFPLNNDALNTQYVIDSWAKSPNKKAMIQVRADSTDTFKFQEPWIPSYYAYDNALINQTLLIAQGKQTVDKAVSEIAKKAASILKIYWDANG